MDAGTDTRDPWTPAAGVQAADRRPCDLVTVPARQGLEAVDILRRGAEPAVGPVLLVGRCDTLGFLVPPGTADRWDVPGSACTTADTAHFRGNYPQRVSLQATAVEGNPGPEELL
ncbi:hypothetical protein ACWEP3_31865, partial [Streptomyces albidoflavus]